MTITDSFIQTAKEIYLKTGKPGFILPSVYDALLAIEEIEPIEQQGEELFKQVERRLEQEAARAGTIELKNFAHEKGTELYMQRLKSECKKQIVANYFTLQNNIDNF